jgi:hypothetical protein
MKKKGIGASKDLLLLFCSVAVLSACGQGNATAEGTKQASVSPPKLRETITVAQLEGMSFPDGPFKEGWTPAKYDPIEQAVSIESCQAFTDYLRQSSACPRFFWQKGKTPVLVLDLKYFGKADWLFMQGVKVAVGDHVVTRTFDWDPAFSKQRDSGDSWHSLYEWRTVVVSDSMTDVAALASGTEARVRLVGRASYVDSDFKEAAKTMSWAAKIYEQYKDTILVK